MKRPRHTTPAEADNSATPMAYGGNIFRWLATRSGHCRTCGALLTGACCTNCGDDQKPADPEADE